MSRHSTGLAEFPFLAPGLAELHFLASPKNKNRISSANCPPRLPRFLCVSNGYEIFCLDLNKGRQQPFTNLTEIPLIPRIGTIDLMKEGLPVSVGLFRLGSQIYIIGGQNFQVSIVDEPHENVLNANPIPSKDSMFVQKESTLLKNKYARDRENSVLSKGFFHLGPDLYRIDEKLAWFIGDYNCWGGDPKGINLYKALCVRCVVKPTSRDIYDVSLAEGTLSFSKSEDIAPLEKPKLWPIVETINGQTHVIDSVPLQLTDYCKGWISSHEVLSRDNKSWSEVLFKEKMGYISFHLVLGSRIYAVAGDRLAVFDSETQQWDATTKGKFGWKSPYLANSVWDIIVYGIGRCVGGGVVYGEPKNPLYVVIALVRDYISHDVSIVVAIAYLVTSDGLVVCWQLLSDFFQGPVKPARITGGTMIDVDEKGLTLCSIISGPENDPRSEDYVYINTFTVKGVTEAKSEVQKVWEEGEKAWPVERDFVRVELKDKYVYKSHDGVESRGMLGVRACLFP